MKHWMRLVVAAVVAVVTMLPMMTIEASAQRFFSPNGNFASNEQPHRLFQRNRARPQMGNPFARQVVKVQMEQPAGTIIVDTSSHFLYLMLGNGEAIRYGIGVARSGFEWRGTHRITNKREWPGWTPPAAMRKRVPGLPAYMPGGLDNPLGARALYIGSTLYRIHGTNEPWSIGQNVSSGCIRMLNDDVIDLYERVRVGARVIVR